jgi:hypothetical protein
VRLCGGQPQCAPSCAHPAARRQQQHAAQHFSQQFSHDLLLQLPQMHVLWWSTAMRAQLRSICRTKTRAACSSVVRPNSACCSCHECLCCAGQPQCGPSSAHPAGRRPEQHAAQQFSHNLLVAAATNACAVVVFFNAGPVAPILRCNNQLQHAAAGSSAVLM